MNGSFVRTAVARRLETPHAARMTGSLKLRCVSEWPGNEHTRPSLSLDMSANRAIHHLERDTALIRMSSIRDFAAACMNGGFGVALPFVA